MGRIRTITICMILGLAASGCDLLAPSSQPASRPADVETLALTADAPHGKLRGLAEYSIVADRTTGNLVISAPAGSFADASPGARVTLWAVSPTALVNGFAVGADSIKVPGQLLGEAVPAADGSFATDVAFPPGHRLLMLAGEADASGHFLVVRADTDATVAYKSPFTEDELKPLTYGDFLTQDDVEPSETSEPGS